MIGAIVDCDPGIDDAIALHVIAAAVLTGAVRLEGVVAAAGNASLDITSRNAAFVCDRLNLHVPVYRGVERSVGVDAHDFHGQDGIGGCYEPDHAAPDQGDGVAWMVDRVRQAAAAGSPLTILAVGPLTNIAAALRLEPRLADLVDRVVVMGGAFRAPGNITKFAEFNFYADAHAAADVFASTLPLIVIPLDVTQQVLVDDVDVDALERAAGGATLATRLRGASIDCHRTAEGRDHCIMHDALAAAALLHPGIMTGETVRVSIMRDGPERGRSIATAGPSGTAWVADGVDVEGARHIILDALA